LKAYIPFSTWQKNQARFFGREEEERIYHTLDKEYRRGALWRWNSFWHPRILPCLSWLFPFCW